MPIIVTLIFSSPLDEHDTAIDFTVSCPLLPSYISEAISDGNAIFATRALEKTKKHAAGSAHRGRHFLPFVITTFGGIGPASAWHYVDSTYSTSSAVASLSSTSFHALSAKKSNFLCSLQATLIRANFAMLTHHTSSNKATATPGPGTPLPPPPSSATDPADPASPPTTPEADD